MSDQTTIVVACENEWGQRLARFSAEGRVAEHRPGQVELQDPTEYLVLIQHPRQIQGIRYEAWSFWCRHHLSEKQLERLDEHLPAHCANTSPFTGDNS